MLKKLFNNLGRKSPESTTIPCDLIIPTTFNLTLTNLRGLPEQDVINPESDPIPPNITPALYDVKLIASRQTPIRKNEIIVPEEPIRGELITPQQIEYKLGDLTNQKLGLRQNPYPKVKRPDTNN